MTLFIHVGMQKTGSKALQNFFRSNADHLNQLGFDYPDDLSNGLWHRDLFTDFSAQRADLLADHLAAGKHVILSLENAYQIDAELIEKVTESASDVRLLMFVRPPVEWLNSFKNQQIKAHRVTYDECQAFDVTGPQISDIFDIRRHLLRWSQHAPVSDIRLEPYGLSTDVIQIGLDWLGIGDRNLAALAQTDFNPNKALSLRGLQVLLEVKRLMRNQPREQLVHAVERAHRALADEMIDTRFSLAVSLLSQDDCALAQRAYLPELRKAMSVWGGDRDLDPDKGSFTVAARLEPDEPERQLARQIAELDH